MKIKEKSTEEKVIRKYLLRLRQPRIKKKENRYYIRGYKGTEVIIRTDHEILKRIAYRRTCVKQVCIPGRYGTETKYIYTRKENRRSRPVIVPGIPTGRETAMPRAVRTVLHALSYGGIEVEASRKLADLKKMDPMRIFYRTLDAEVYNGDYKVPIRLFFQQKRTWKTVPPPEKTTSDPVFPWRWLGYGKCRELSAGLCQNGTVYRSDRGVC